MEDLARHFLVAVERRLGLEAHCLSPAAVLAMADHTWPGNVRELRNRIERAAAMADQAEIGPADLFPERRLGDPADGAPAASLRDAVGQATKAQIQAALGESNGNRAEAARRLGISRTTLWKRMQEHGL